MNPTLIFNRLVAGQRVTLKKQHIEGAKKIKAEIIKLQELAATVTKNPELVTQIRQRLDELHRSINK